MSHETIMVVDDEPDTVELLKLALEDEGYNVVVAYSGVDCLEKVKKMKVDLIMLDIMMPKMSGWVVFLNLQKDKRTRGIPVMVGTCKSLSDESKSKVKLLGIKDYIIKPFHLETLSEKVRYILDNEKRKS